jgi:hypothetical protein
MNASKKNSRLRQSFQQLVPMGVLLLAAQSASALDAQVCIQDNWKDHGNTQNLTCTANDVRVAEAFNICAPDLDDPTVQCCQADGCKPSCIKNTEFTFTADFKVLLTAQTRYDIGIYFATDGGNGDGALTGECELNTIDDQNGDNFINIDSAPDVCGDIKNTSALNPQIVHLEVTTLCAGTEANPDVLNLPNCTSWRQSGANEECKTATDAFPGSPSKCNCQPIFPIDISLEEPNVEVTKTAKEACVTFEVKVDNTTQTRILTLTALADDIYGNIANAANANLCSTTCGQATGAGVLPVTLDPGENYTCSFAAKVASDDDAQTDKVTASLTDEEDDPIAPSPVARETVIVDLDVPTP